MTDNRNALPSAQALIRFLKGKGWTESATSDARLTKLQLEEPQQDPIELYFSDVEEPSQRASEIDFALSTASSLYDESKSSILTQIRSALSDLILSKIPDEYVRNDSIPLDTAATYISGMKTFLASSATTEISGEKFFKRTLKEALEYSNHCRFGHTFEGSFGFVVESPVGFNKQPDMFGPDPQRPLSRRVVERIVYGFQSYNRAVATEDPSYVSNSETGFSANMCDDLVGLLEDTGLSKVSFDVRLSHEWRTVVSQDVGQQFALEQRYLDLLREASSALRIRETPKQENILGRVVRLHSESAPSDIEAVDKSRDITVSWDSAEYGLIKVNVSLNSTDYLLAIEAHKAGKLVSLSGLLERQGRGWVAQEVAGVRLLT